jgi:hypothetical protein
MKQILIFAVSFLTSVVVASRGQAQQKILLDCVREATNNHSSIDKITVYYTRNMKKGS